MECRWVLVLVSLTAGLWACSGDDAAGAGGAGTGGAGATGGTTAAGGAGGSTTSGSGGAAGSSATGGGGGAVSSGCGSTAAPTGVLDQQSIEAGGLTRTYVLSVPTSYDPSTPLPLVFAWHGLGGSGQLARLYFGVEQQSGGAAIFVYPDGLEVPGYGGTGWVLDVGGRDVLLFDALLAQLEQTYCIDEGRIFSTGHSFGGYFSNTLGCARAGVLAAIAPVAGGGPFVLGCSGPLSAWITHGANDPTVPLAQGVGSRDFWLAQNGCTATTSPVSPPPCESYDGCQSGTQLVWCLHQGGHEWPGFAAAGIWGFFSSLP